jgi:protein SCO1
VRSVAVTRAPLRRLCRLLGGVLLLAACGEPTLRGIAIDPPLDVAAFRFAMSDGRTFSTAPEAGRPLMVFFGYTHCPDVCPVTLADWARAKTELGARAERVRWLFVSVDPQRDSAAVAERYARQFDASFIGVSGDSATTAAIQQAFAVTSFTTPGTTNEEYFVTHASQSFLVDDQGRVRAMYAFNRGVAAMVADLNALLD